MKKRVDHHVFVQTEIQDQAVAVAVFGDMAQPRFGAPLDRVMGNILPVKEYPATFGLYKSRKGVDQLRLPVAVDAAESQDFAPADFQG